MSMCRFNKTGIHLTTYLKWLTTPSCTRNSCPPQVWCQNRTKPVCPLGLWKWLKFQILAIQRIRAKQDHEAGSPGLHWYVRWRADSIHQTTKVLYNVGAWSSIPVMPQPKDLWTLPENVLHIPTQHVFHLFGYSPSSGDGRSELCMTLLFLIHGATTTPTGDLLLTKPKVL